MDFMPEDNMIMPDLDVSAYGNDNDWDHIPVETDEPVALHIQQIDYNADEVQKMVISDHEEKMVIHTQTHCEDPKTPFPDFEKHVAISYQNNGVMSYPNSGAASCANNEEMNPETQPSKRRKRKSMVWEHFTIETVSAGCRRAYCNECKRSYAYSKGSKVSGTSHLRRHVEKGSCAARLCNRYNNNQSDPSSIKAASNAPKRCYKRASGTGQFVFDQNNCRNDIARMIIMHDYPLHMVEHPGFVSFVQNLQPQFNFNMLTFDIVQGDCIATYQMEKQKLTKVIQGMAGRLCLSVDMWTATHGVGYLFVTGHFIDADWKLHRRLLNVVMEPYPDSDTALCNAVKGCLHNWSLENKVFSITYHGQTLIMSQSGFESSIKLHLPLNGQLFAGNCLAHTLSSIAKEVLGNGHDIVKKIRDSIKYVMTSEPHEEKFLMLKEQLQDPSQKNIFLDDQTQWNTTYQMLVAASELKQVFSCLDTYDAEFSKQAPSLEDWKQVETLCTCLKPVFDTAYIIATTTNPTANLFFNEVCTIQQKLCITSEDPFVSNHTRTMLEEITRYWNNCSLILAIAVVMDPRFKMKIVEFYFNKIYDEEKAPTYIKMVDDRLHELFQESITMPSPLAPNYAEEFDVSIMKNLKTELDQYLVDPLVTRYQEFDVLGWWHLNQMMYPTVSKMARDILSIPVSTVPCDSVFNTNAKEIDQYRSCLQAETVDALLCAKDWMQYGSPVGF